MLSLNLISSFLFPSSIEEVEPEVLKIGDYVWVQTLCYGLQLGRVESIVPSPFYGDSGMTAYVCGNGWSEYLPVDVEMK